MAHRLTVSDRAVREIGEAVRIKRRDGSELEIAPVCPKASPPPVVSRQGRKRLSLPATSPEVEGKPLSLCSKACEAEGMPRIARESVFPSIPVSRNRVPFSRNPGKTVFPPFHASGIEGKPLSLHFAARIARERLFPCLSWPRYRGKTVFPPFLPHARVLCRSGDERRHRAERCHDRGRCRIDR